MKKQIGVLSNTYTQAKSMTDEKMKEETNTNLLSLMKYLIDQNARTTLILKRMSENIEKLESEVNVEYGEENQSENLQYPQKLMKELPISELDAKILQFIQRQRNSMACAEDLKSLMNYKGKNAASSRLNRLYKADLLTRYQLGHKVYYKFDAGKATNTLIVSPPQ